VIVEDGRLDADLGGQIAHGPSLKAVCAEEFDVSFDESVMNVGSRSCRNNAFKFCHSILIPDSGSPERY
jgi:hypothetical protein